MINYTCYSSVNYTTSQVQILLGIALNKYGDKFFSARWVCLRSSQYRYELLIDIDNSGNSYDVIQYISNTSSIYFDYYRDNWNVNYNGYTYLSNDSSETYASYPIDLYNTHYEHITNNTISVVLIVILIFTVLSLFIRKLF